MPVSASVSASRSLQARLGLLKYEKDDSAPSKGRHQRPSDPRACCFSASNLDLRGSVVRFVTDRRSADRAEGAGDRGRRAKTAKLLRPLQELEITAIEDGPRRSGRAGREPASAAMTPTQGQRRSTDAEPYGAAQTTTFVDVRRDGHLNAEANTWTNALC
jgi:hypothetical protein